MSRVGAVAMSRGAGDCAMSIDDGDCAMSRGAGAMSCGLDPGSPRLDGGGRFTQIAPRVESITHSFCIAVQSNRRTALPLTSQVTATCPLSLSSQRPFSVTPLHPAAVGPPPVPSGGDFG